MFATACSSSKLNLFSSCYISVLFRRRISASSFPLHLFLLKLRKKISSKFLRVKCNPGHKWIECSENVCTMYRATLADAPWSLFCRAFRKNYVILLKGPGQCGQCKEDSLQWIAFVEFSTTNGTVHSDRCFLVYGSLIFHAHISLSHPHILNAWNRLCECRYKYSNSVIRLIRGTSSTLHIKLALRATICRPIFRLTEPSQSCLRIPNPDQYVIGIGKISILKSFLIFSNELMILIIQEHIKVVVTETDSQNTFKNRTKCK